MEHLRLDGPGRFLAPVDYSCMGYAVPAAIGATLANPGRDVVALAGDGAFLMTGLELITAARVRRRRRRLPPARRRAGADRAVPAHGARRSTANSVLPPYDVEALRADDGARYVPCGTGRGSWIARCRRRSPLRGAAGR